MHVAELHGTTGAPRDQALPRRVGSHRAPSPTPPTHTHTSMCGPCPKNAKVFRRNKCPGTRDLSRGQWQGCDHCCGHAGETVLPCGSSQSLRTRPGSCGASRNSLQPGAVSSKAEDAGWKEQGRLWVRPEPWSGPQRSGLTQDTGQLPNWQQCVCACVHVHVRVCVYVWCVCPWE